MFTALLKACPLFYGN